MRHHLRPAGRPLAGVVAGGVVGSVLVIVQAWAVAGLVLAVVRHGDVPRAGLLVVGVLAARAAAGVLVDLCAARAAAAVGSDLRRRLVRGFVADHARRTPRAAGDWAALVTRGVAASEPYLTRYLPALVLAVVLPPVTVVAIAALDPVSALIVVATLPLVPVFGALVGLATRERAERQWRAMSSLSGHFLDVVRGLPTLVAHNRAEVQSATIRRVTDRYRRASMATLRIAFASSAVLELVATLSVALVAVVVGLRLAQGGIGLHTALVVLLLAPEAYWPLRRVGAEFHAAAEGAATFEQVSDLLDGSGQAPPSDDGVPTDDPIVVRGLRVTHPGRTAPALHDLDLTVPARGVTVMTGPSGCGKSTLLGVLAGLVEPQSGSVTVGGRPVGGDEWRRRVAWLPQRPVFVSGSIADNLRLAAPDAPDSELWQVLGRVALEERVRAMPAGLASPVSEDAANLSAGERARLALARVVLAGRDWVLLDEPTAHLDDLTEQVIADTIVELGRTAAVVVVAHRPALAALAEHVVEIHAPAARPSSPPHARRSAAPAPGLEAPTPDLTPMPSTRRSLAVSRLLGALASGSGVALTATAGWLIVQASTRPPVLTLLVAIVAVRTFGLARPVLRYAERLRSHDVALRLLADRRVEVYDALVPLTPGRLGRRRGDLLASVVDDVDAVVDREVRVRSPLAGAVLVGSGAALLAGSALPALGVAVAVAGPVAGLAAFGLARRGSARAEGRLVAARAELSRRAVEVTQVAEDLEMWQAGPSAAEQVGAVADGLAGAAVRAARWPALARAALLLVTGAAMALAGELLAPAVVAGDVSGPVSALLVLLPLALLEVTTPLAEAGSVAARTRAAATRLASLAETPPAVREPRGPVTARAPYAVSAEQVAASWDGAPVLEELSLAIGPAERVGLVGPSGSGKSTVAALLLRFIDPDGGRISLGGAELDRLPLREVRHAVGLVDDDPHVFATTLVENVRFARPGATDEEVETALRQACLGPWVDSLPDGLGTWLGDGNADVSGGERTRLAIARSLLADQPVLVLDEPTAHLDTATATSIADEVLGAADGRSVLWITHGSVGLDHLDHVLRLDGSHEPAVG
nr:thiol reductant ABC exporter subunit CydD [Nocardioides ginsengisegetis]